MAITLSIIESVRNGELIDELAIEIYIKEWLVPLNAGKAKEDPLWIVRTS